MPPEQRPIPRFVAEPPREGRPYGRWADSLAVHFLEACQQIDTDEDLGDPGDVVWFPDRTFAERTYIPATAPTSEGFEVFGFVSFVREPDAEDLEFWSRVEYTDETAEANPDWKLDLSDYEIGEWRGRETLTAKIALVWGVALVRGGAVATAELGPTTTDQCEVVDARFTLVSLEEWTGDLLEVRLYDAKGGQLASESLYEEE